jgi:glycosyltransferase involved in cell wall biosynthesis
MKILIISNDKSIFTEKGQFFNELKECSKQIEEIHVIVQTVKKDNLTFKKIQENIFLYPTNSFNSLFFIYDTFVLARAQLTFKFHLIADLIVADRDDFNIGFSAYMISWKYGKNFIIDVHQDYLEVEQSNLFKRLAKRDMNRFLFKRAVGIHVSSQDVGEKIYSDSPYLIGRIYILPFVSDVERVRQVSASFDIHQKIKKYDIILIQKKKLIPFSDIVRAKRIMRRLKKRYPHIGLILVGKIKFYFINWLRIILLPRSITFKRHADMASYYKTANVCIDTASPRTADRRNEMDIINAVFSGCPIVASQTIITENLIKDGENGFFVDARDSKRFARKVIDILEKPGLREQIRIAHFNLAEIYGESLDGYISRLINIWETCKSIGEKDAHIDKYIPKPESKIGTYLKAVTVATLESAKLKVAHSVPTENVLAPGEGDINYIFDVDRIKTDFEEALREINDQADQDSAQQE